MEDGHATCELPSEMGLYAVFDGHGGEEVAMFVSRHTHEVMKDIKPDFTHEEVITAFKSLDDLMEACPAELAKCTHSARKNRGSVHKMRVLEIRRDNPDLAMDEINGQVVRLTVGCTATVTLVHGNMLHCANVGDSKAVLAREVSAAGARAFDMSREHSLHLPEEVARVVAAGFEVGGEPPRISEELAVARSLGDARYKQVEGLPPAEQPVSCVPEIISTELKDGDEFMVVACDGIFEVMSSQDTIDFVHKGLAAGTEPSVVLQQLLDACMAPSMPTLLGGDNMTAMIVFLKPQ